MQINMSSWRHNLEEIRLLGARKFAYRVWFEVGNRSGLREKIESGRVRAFEPAALDFDAWWESLGREHWFRQIRRDVESGVAREQLRGWLGKDGEAELLKQAEDALGGQIVCFSRWSADYAASGDDVSDRVTAKIDWHLNPRNGERWPLEASTRVLSHAARCGDVKYTWEINRFPHLYAWVRAYTLTGDSKWVRAFCEQLADWEEANPYREGVNWSSGQELAIRLMAWCFAVAAMGADNAFTDVDFERFQRLSYQHAEHIDANIEYARLAVHNNHLIGEALGLYLVGSLFPEFGRAKKWVKKGKKLLLEDSLDQFFEDGGYCQSSHTYHRLALHYYLWAFRLGAFEDEPRRVELKRLLGRSAEYLEQFVNEADGRLPNWGANDGALLNPWTACDFGDFRPLLTALRYLGHGKRSFEGGAWDEELFWFFGRDALEAPVSPVARESRSFGTSGLHTLRKGGDDFAVFRCGSVIDRFGQADQLHVDIWHRGKNIAIDGGSYCYNDELAFHRWFMGSASHNTVTVDGLDQMLLYRRFKWLYWTQAESDGVAHRAVEGLHRGYEKLGVTHRRQVSALADGWRVMDTMERTDSELRTFRLHWLLGGDVVSPVYDSELRQWSARFDVDGVCGTLRVEATDQASGRSTLPERACAVQCSVAEPEPSSEVAGWHARYYGERLPASSVSVEIETRRAIRFASHFKFDD